MRCNNNRSNRWSEESNDIILYNFEIVSFFFLKKSTSTNYNLDNNSFNLHVIWETAKETEAVQEAALVERFKLLCISFNKIPNERTGMDNMIVINKDAPATTQPQPPSGGITLYPSGMACLTLGPLLFSSSWVIFLSLSLSRCLFLPFLLQCLTIVT